MSTLTDALFGIEMDLAKYPGDSENDCLNRRVILRQAFTEYGDGRFREGYQDGRRDVMDARSEAKRRADAAGDSQ